MQVDPGFLRVLDVLVVDDIDQSRNELAGLVGRLGHRVAMASSGDEALDQVHDQMPDIVLLDLLMPQVDGFEVTRRIRATAPGRWVPVIVTSSLRGDSHFCHALQLGADDFLARPVNPELLEAKLRHYARVLELQRQAAAAMQRQRDIHDNISDAVLTLDQMGMVLDVNMAACRRFGAEQPAGLLGCGCQEVTGRTLAELTAGGEITVVGAGGRAFPAEIGTSQWHDDGQMRFTLVVRDLSERRAVERLKDEFLATVSHELRTPLTSIVGAIGLVVAGKAGELPAMARPLLEMAHRNTERLGRLIDDLLDLTKLEGDRMALHMRRMSAAALVRDAVDANLGYAQRAGIRLVGEPTHAAADVRVDPDRFLQVMSNLISNAIKHSPPQGTVTVALTVASHDVRFGVRDEGPGIPADFRQRMFDKFSQVDGSDQRAKGGTGLGLYVARLLVERMSGRIDVVPIDGAGTEFGVELPRDDVPTPSGRPALWVIDRDVDTVRRLQGWLGARWQVFVADVPPHAGASRASERPAVVVADPQGQGMADEFCDGLRRLARGGPVLLYSDAVDADFVARQGFGWLRKSSGGADALERALARLNPTAAERRADHG